MIWELELETIIKGECGGKFEEGLHYNGVMDEVARVGVKGSSLVPKPVNNLTLEPLKKCFYGVNDKISLTCEQ